MNEENSSGVVSAYRRLWIVDSSARTAHVIDNVRLHHSHSDLVYLGLGRQDTWALAP